MNKYSVYLAGPISGLDYNGGVGWRQEAMDFLHDNNIDSFSPLRRKDYLKGEGSLTGSYEDWPLSTQRGIYTRDRFDCHRVDLVLANLHKDVCGWDDSTDTPKVSIGTVMEIAWAAQNNTPIVLIMDKGNIHHHPMLEEACPYVVDNLSEALDIVTAILLPSNHD
jgi:nucleoside 2-deoxyribosyltransferase